ncbi:BrnA antitoxin family protein [Duganella violaceipulchra]|uniref:Uncharacterized protein (DUF4415 family) n=1 Tax=Duganella violaceipulchra TaxID=2849652 RepID=A0ABT1GUL1_9BURK|nr:BrnA antitoxin family protein [Duganella violaceicalia]MCP2012283.1 uncharacterized protein (DUF4415 family) [Duganella violaceicalia]
MKKKLPYSKDTLVDEDDAPALSEAWFAEASLYRGGVLVKRGRPPQAVTKVAVKLRLDRDIVAAFKIDGPGWQTRINQALRDWLVLHPGEQGDAINSLGRAALENPDLPASLVADSLASLAEPREQAQPFTPRSSRRK